MSIRRRSKFSRNHGNSRHTGSGIPGCRPGFTLIELLVVVAIIAILISILLPSLKAAREAAKAVVCGQKLRDMGNGLQQYMGENSDWIPGVNTSGVAIQTVFALVDRYYDPHMPVQTFDWMTPTIGMMTELPAQRAARFRELINEFACPSQAAYPSVVYLPSTTDSADFNPDDDWVATSYLMPAHFQLWGWRHKDDVLAYHESNTSMAIKAKVVTASWEAAHQTYRSKLNEVGNPGRKIAVAEGTRYLPEPNEQWDIEVAEKPEYFGSFTSSGAWWAGCASYGVRNNTLNWGGQRVSTSGHGQGQQLELSYRHGTQRGAGSGACQDNKGSINAMFFDGSVRRLNDRESRNPVCWYPTGTKVNIPTQGMTTDLKQNDLVP